MLIVKRNIYRNVSEQEAEAYKQQGYSPVSEQYVNEPETEEEIKKPAVKRGGKRGDNK